MNDRNIELIEVTNAVRVVFNLKLNQLTGRNYIELVSPSYHFRKPTNDQWRIKFLSVLDGVNTGHDRYDYNYYKEKLVPSITLHIDARNRDHPNQICVYQVVASVQSFPELGVIAFQSRHVSQSYINHPRMFSINQLQHAASKDGGLVRVCFEISCYNERDNALPTVGSSTNVHQAVQENVSLLNLFSFLEEGAYSDVTLRAEGREFKAHKLILAAQSSVFSTMFRSNMQEAQTGVIEIGFSADVVEEMLRFIYTNKTRNLSMMPLDLFAAAHMYDLETLQRICKGYVCANIDADNVTEVLKFSERYALHEVIRSAMDFISLHEPDVVLKNDYIEYLLERLKPDNVANYLELSRRYALTAFREGIVKFISKNFAQVMKDKDYRELYRTDIHLIMDVDERLTKYLTPLN